MVLDENSCTFIDGRPFVSVTYPNNVHDGLFIQEVASDGDIRYINDNNIEKVYLKGMADYDFLKECPSIKYLAIEFQLPRKKLKNLPIQKNKYIAQYDLSPIYEMPDLKMMELLSNEHENVATKCTVDLNKLKKLESVSGDCQYMDNIDCCTSLRSIYLVSYKPKSKNLEEFSKLRLLDTITLTQCSIESLKGIESLSKITCLYLYYNRNLRDIHDLMTVKDSIRALEIMNCPNIQDLEQLSNLTKLKTLSIWGKGEIQNIKFIEKMKNLKSFLFELNVLNGDLTPCLKLLNVKCIKDRRHYNYKNSDLPKLPYGKFIRGNETIDVWRRLF